MPIRNPTISLVTAPVAEGVTLVVDVRRGGTVPLRWVAVRPDRPPRDPAALSHGIGVNDATSILALPDADRWTIDQEGAEFDELIHQLHLRSGAAGTIFTIEGFVRKG